MNHDHDPIISGIEKVVGIVAHAIPGVGPVVDAAVPALQAVFSDDSTPPPPPADDHREPPPSIEPLLQPLTVNLQRNTKEIEEVLSKVTKIEDTLESSIREVSNEIHEVSSEIDKKIQELKNAHQHEKYVDFKSKLTARM